MKRFKVGLTLILTVLIILSTITVATAFATTTDFSEYVLVHDKGDIGRFNSNGTISYSTSEDDYVWIRNYNSGIQYCTDGWQGFVDTALLVNEKSTTQFNKLYVSAGEHTLTLKNNGNDTFTLSYGIGGEITSTSPIDTPEYTVSYMNVGDVDTSFSGTYDQYSSIMTITADSSNPKIASIIIDPDMEHSVTITALSAGETIITVYTNGVVYQKYKIIVSDANTEPVTSIPTEPSEYETKYMTVGSTDTSASEMYDNYSKLFGIKVTSSNENVATVIIDSNAEHSVTVSALSIGETFIKIYVNDALYQTYKLVVTSSSEPTLSYEYVLVQDSGDIGKFDSFGQLTYTASEETYVWVRNYNTGVQYCTDGWQGFVDTVTLVNEKITSKFDKLYVPAGTHEFKLSYSGNDTFKLSYASEIPEIPTEPVNPPDDRKLNFVVLGDSIAVGYGLNSTDNGYPKLIADEKNYNLKNDAVNGHASYDLLSLLNNDKTVISDVTNADIISISIGGNDFLQNINDLITNVTEHGIDCEYIDNIINNLQNNLDDIIEKIKALNPDAVIILQTVYNPAAIRPIIPAAAALSPAYPKFNQTFTDIAAKHSNVHLADVYTAFEEDYASRKDSTIIQSDGIHPSESGNVIIFNTILGIINKLNSSEDTYTIGDVNNDGVINIKDATAIQKHVADISYISGNALLASDTNLDGKVNIKDATEIQKYVADMLTTTNIGTIVAI